MFKKGDIFIYFFILIALLFTGNIAFRANKSNSDKFEIYFNGKLSYVYPLSHDRKEYIIEAPLGKEKIVTEKFYVWKESSSCNRSSICSHRKIKISGDSLLCLPNKEIVKITGNEEYDYIIK